MITLEEVLKLREAIPIRYPLGDPRNEARIKPEKRFEAALRRYKKEHGRSWFEDMKGGKK